jgi:hypothetical protein
MITPSIGRVVWYYQHGATQRDANEQPRAALVAYVWHDRMINLGGFDSNGVPFAATSVRLLQDDEQPDAQQPFAQWMPYQVATAKKDVPAASTLPFPAFSPAERT